MRTRILLAAALTLAATVSPAGHADPPISSPNVELVATLPSGIAVGGKFVGKHFFQTIARPGGVTFPSVANTGGLAVFDATDPETPVPTAFLPLPHWQNEDVDVSAKRKLLLLSNQPMNAAADRRLDGTLYLIDISNPSLPRIAGTLTLPGVIGTRENGSPLGGPGHTASCVLDCAYAYIAGARDGTVWVADLRNVAAPKIIGRVGTPAGRATDHYSPGVIHDVHVDNRGNVWIMGSGGTAMYAPLRNPLKPKLLAAVSIEDNETFNQLIHHGALRVENDVVYITEEDLDTSDCGQGEDDGEVPQDGSFQTWRVDRRTRRLVPLDTYDMPQGNSAPSFCSSHWFDVNTRRVVADAWYGQGVRFLDVSNPRNIREVGWFKGPLTSAGQVQFVPGRDDLVYVSDYGRGLDVLRIDKGGKGAPTTAQPATRTAEPSRIEFRPSADFGWACPLPTL